MTKEQAITKAIEWNELIGEADAEEMADCFQAAERLRIEAADIEKEIRDAGFDAYKLYKEQQRVRR